MSGGGQYNYDFGYGTGYTDPETGVNQGAGDATSPGEVSSGDATAGIDWSSIFTTGSGGNSINLGKLTQAVLGGSGGGAGAGLALGLGALAAALTQQKAPTIKAPEYKPAPVYNRALTAPLFQPQPTPQKSASGQNIYTPMRGMPLFFNPNPFQFDATEAAKRYGPTPEQIAQGQAGYEAGLASLYKPITITPFTYPGTSTVTGATGNDTVAGASSTTTDTNNVVTSATGGSVDDILVGYNEGGDVYMAAGRYLSGGGDGMSDSIPATINNRQPARLADGEFVVPADVVSDLGNGSSNAGAKKLYAMMKKIRQSRHGTTKQPPQVKAERAMPR